MKHLRKIFSLLILVSVLSCSSKNENASFKMTDEEIVATIAEEKEDIGMERKLIKEGSVEFETADINATRKIILAAIKKYSGYTSSDQEYTSPGRISNTIIIRVPAKEFDKLFIEATRDIAKFDSKEIEIKDVTEEFLDIQARLKTKKELENRYLELLKKANSVTEILEVEKQMEQLRSDIESVEGRLKYLESKISLSTLIMTFYQKVPNKIVFKNKFKNGFSNGWDNLIWFFVFLANIWPYILIVIGLIFGLRCWKKKKDKRRQ